VLVHVEISDPTLADDLVAFLRRASCEAELTAGRTLSVRVPSVPGDVARLVDGYLEAWQALHRGVSARRRCAYGH
jgi:hypothetical protein